MRGRLPAWSTPLQLWLLMGAITVSAVLVFLAVSGGVSDSRRAVQTVGTDTVPTINHSLDLYFALCGMDADVANYLLLATYPSPSLTPTQLVNQYEEHRRTVSTALDEAAQSIVYGEVQRVPVYTLTVGVQRYDTMAGRAELLSDQGDRAGALVAYRQATDLMHDLLLPEATILAQVSHDALAAGYRQAGSDETRDDVLILLSGLLLLVCWLALQVVLARRLRRLLNLPVLAAGVLTGILVVGAVVTLTADGAHLQVAKRGAYDAVYALRQLRAFAFDADADESRYLADPGRRSVYEQNFMLKATEIASFDHLVDISTYDAALARSLSALQSGQPSGLRGVAGQALANVSFPGEGAASRAALVAYQTYQLDDRIMRGDVQGGDVQEAARFQISTAHGDSKGDFSAFDAALGRWIGIDQDAFDRAIAAGQGTLGGWQLYPAIAMLLVVVLAFVGLRPRIGEYA